MFLLVKRVILCYDNYMTKRKPLVSVIMATYNDEDFVEESIQSVLTQDFDDFEFIIINDGSTDKTPHILKKIASQDKRIRLVNQKNQGLVKSLNRALFMAEGEYIARIDGDDQWLPGKLSSQMNYLQKNPKTVIISGAREEFDLNSIPFNFVFTSHTHEQIMRTVTISNPFTHSSVVFKKNIALQCGGYPDMCPVEDYALFSQMLDYGQAYIVPYPIIRYRSNPNGISQKNHHKQVKMSDDLSKQIWEKHTPKVLSRAQLIKEINHLLNASITKEFGISLKHYFLFINTRIGYRMFKQGRKLDGIKQLINIILTGRTGFRIVRDHGNHVVQSVTKKSS